MKFDFKKNTENKEDKLEIKEITILSYETAYNRLIKRIKKHYWPLDQVKLDVLDEDLQKDPEIKALQIDWYIPKYREPLHGGLLGGSGNAGEKRLSDFLKDVYMTQASTKREEGCLPLLRAITAIISGKNGHHLPGQLADAARQGIFTATPTSIKPGEKTIVLTGKLARQGFELLENLKIEAEKRCHRYFSKEITMSDETLLNLAGLP